MNENDNLTLIQKEHNAADDYKFDPLPGKEGLVKLCRKNVALAEAAIRNDSSYLKSSNPKACPNGKYEGSTAFWMTQLKDILIFGKSVSSEGFDFETALMKAVTSVDRENSTHLNADGGGDGGGRNEMFERLRKVRGQLVELLRNPQSNDYRLIQILSEPTTAKDGTGRKGGKFKARRNLSFASKFCQEACFWMFEGEEEQDNFSKYDNVVLNAIPTYLKQYKITGFAYRVKDFNAKDVEAYKKYHAAIDAILNSLDEKISRNGFDHLIWYYYKGRPELLKVRRAGKGE